MAEPKTPIAEEGFGEPFVKNPSPKPKRKWTNKEELIGWTFACIPIIGFLIFGLIPICLSFLT